MAYAYLNFTLMPAQTQQQDGVGCCSFYNDIWQSLLDSVKGLQLAGPLSQCHSAERLMSDVALSPHLKTHRHTSQFHYNGRKTKGNVNMPALIRHWHISDFDLHDWV